ncbi:ADAMTS-like protein 1 [Grus japonensis]|uniref:ADAMTS-like protein 1 n=1 Tax=Grus japonensis TaxID=30415 RepID=A0ABC9Y3S5_GRUJA
MAAVAGQRRGTAASLLALALRLLAAAQVCGDQNQGAVFLREFTLIRRESLHDDFLSDLLNNHKTEDPVGIAYYSKIFDQKCLQKYRFL